MVNQKLYYRILTIKLAWLGRVSGGWLWAGGSGRVAHGRCMVRGGIFSGGLSFLWWGTPLAVALAKFSRAFSFFWSVPPAVALADFF